MDPQKFCLKWNDYRHSVSAAFEGLRQDEELVDMTLCCEGRKIRAHRMMLSACSPFFRELLKENPCQHPVFFLRDVSYQDLWLAIEFVYKGEVNVSQSNLASFLKTAEMLQLRGLTDDDNNKNPDGQPAAAVSPRPAAAQAGPVRRDSGPGWKSEPTEATAKPAKRPRTHHTAGPPPPPTAAALGPLAVKREMSPPSPPPPPPPPLPPPAPFGPAGEVGYSAEQEPDAGLGTILYHDLNSGPAALVLDSEGPTDDGGPTSLQLLEPDASAERDASRLPAPPLGPSGPPPAAATAAENPGRHACRQCGARFRNEGSLQHHVKVHQGRTVCPVCHVTYNRVHYLRTHMASKHGMSMPEVKQLLTAVHAQAAAAAPTQWTDEGAVGDPDIGGV